MHFARFYFFPCQSAPSRCLPSRRAPSSGRSLATDGGVLPGVTVEARSDVLPGAPRHGDRRERRLPACRRCRRARTPSRSTCPACRRHPEGRGAARAGHVARRQDGRAGRGGDGHGHGDGVARSTRTPRRSRAACPERADHGAARRRRSTRSAKLIPGVQYTQDTTRGPSAGGSGQDNVYQFDGVNVTLPLFGTLSAEPASHDIAQVTVIKGGARAVDFDRSGGFSIDSVSKSGTSRFRGQVELPVPDRRHGGGPRTAAASRATSRTAAGSTLNIGGPIVKDGSTSTAPTTGRTRTRDNRANLYGELPDYDSTRNEGFGKLTFTPTQSRALELQLPRLASAWTRATSSPSNASARRARAARRG